jgi:ABC-2 type transport system permease protein
MQFYRVFSHEYGNLIRSKFFRILTLVILFGIILLFTIPPITANKSNSTSSAATKSLLVVDSTGMFTLADFSSESGYTVTFQQGNTTVDQLKAQTNAGVYDDAMLISKEPQEKIGITFVAKSVLDSLPQDMQTIIAAANIKNIMAQYNVPSSAIGQALTAPELTVITTTNNNLASGFLPSYIFIMLLFYSIVIYGVMVASGVAQEKSSRAMELLITSARTKNLILGKIIGIGLAGLTQLAIWMAGIFIFYHVNFSYWKGNAIIAGLLGANASNLVLMLLFFLLGFFMYAALYGSIGSIVSRTEDIQLFQLPITFLLIVGLFCSTIGMVMPGSLLTVLSFIPIYTPMSMFVRISISDVPGWQVALSIALSAATVVAFAWVAVKVYRVGVLMYGKTPSIKEVFRALRTDKTART